MNTLLNPATIELMEDKGFTDNLLHDGMGSSHYNVTIAESVMWLYEKYGVWIYVSKPDENGWVIHWQGLKSYPVLIYFNSPTEAYEVAILYTLNNLI